MNFSFNIIFLTETIWSYVDALLIELLPFIFKSIFTAYFSYNNLWFKKLRSVAPRARPSVNQNETSKVQFTFKIFIRETFVSTLSIWFISCFNKKLLTYVKNISGFKFMYEKVVVRIRRKTAAVVRRFETFDQKFWKPFYTASKDIRDLLASSWSVWVTV